jgi:4-aminobutyrate aminotransferase-like enzyme
MVELAESARRAGALVLADEVQSGFGRSGPLLWSFARTGNAPDLVTLGKPMGNGYPVAAVLTRSDIAAALSASREYFSTSLVGRCPQSPR